jgi:hypothetical protein
MEKRGFEFCVGIYSYIYICIREQGLYGQDLRGREPGESEDSFFIYLFIFIFLGRSSLDGLWLVS